MPPVNLTQEQLAALLEQAAESGAKKALVAVGLHDSDAAGDVRDLRGLLDAWREAKTTAVKVTMTIFLTAIAAAIGLKVWTKE